MTLIAGLFASCVLSVSLALFLMLFVVNLTRLLTAAYRAVQL